MQGFKNDKADKMSTMQEQYGRKRKEAYLIKELEKVRQETKKVVLPFREKLRRCKPPEDAIPPPDLQGPGPGPSRPSLKERAVCAGPPQPPGPRPGKGLAPPAQLALQMAAQGPGGAQAVVPQQPRAFRAREFYMRSSAFLRYRVQKQPPAIAAQAGTSRPLALQSPKALRSKVSKSRPRSPRSSASRSAAKEAQDSSLETPKAELLGLPEAPGLEEQVSEVVLQPSESGGPMQPKRVRIHTHYVRESSKERPEAVARSEPRESLPPGDAYEPVSVVPLPERVAPRSIEEIIASLQSEAQLASDQTVMELIQSVLGHSYRLRMQSIPLMETYQEEEESQNKAEQRLQIPQQNVHVVPIGMESSTLQIEQEDVTEWGVSDAESSYKTHEVQLMDESSKPLEGVRTTDETKVVKQIYLKNFTEVPHP